MVQVWIDFEPFVGLRTVTEFLYYSYAKFYRIDQKIDRVLLSDSLSVAY